MARGRKNAETRQLSPEERMREIWDQQVFFIRKKFPQAETQIAAIRKSYQGSSKAAFWTPSEEATNALRELYYSLNR